MTASDWFAIVAGSVGVISGIGALITAKSKKRVDSASFSNLVSSTCSNLLRTVRKEMEEQKTYFEDRIKKLEDIIKKKDNYITSIRCDKIDCPNRIPPKTKTE